MNKEYEPLEEYQCQIELVHGLPPPDKIQLNRKGENPLPKNCRQLTDIIDYTKSHHCVDKDLQEAQDRRAVREDGEWDCGVLDPPFLDIYR